MVEILGFKKGYLIFDTIFFLSIMPLSVVANLTNQGWLNIILAVALIVNAIYIVVHIIIYSPSKIRVNSKGEHNQ